MTANKNKTGVPFQYAESLFAALVVVKSVTELSYRHLQETKSIIDLRAYCRGDLPPLVKSCAEFEVTRIQLWWNFDIRIQYLIIQATMELIVIVSASHLRSLLGSRLSIRTRMNENLNHKSVKQSH